MEKQLSILKKIFVISGLLTVSFLLSYNYRIFQFYQNELTTLVFIFPMLVFPVSMYLYFIFKDINKNNFIYLKKLNYFGFLVFILVSIYWFLVYKNPYDAIAYFFVYFIVFSFVNLIIMSIIFLLKKTGDKYFYKEWLLIIVPILIYEVYKVF